MAPRAKKLSPLGPPAPVTEQPDWLSRIWPGKSVLRVRKPFFALPEDKTLAAAPIHFGYSRTAVYQGPAEDGRHKVAFLTGLTGIGKGPQYNLLVTADLNCFQLETQAKQREREAA